MPVTVLCSNASRVISSSPGSSSISKTSRGRVTTIIGISSRLLGKSRHAAGRRSATADARAERQGQKIAHLDTPGLTSSFNGAVRHGSDGAERANAFYLNSSWNFLGAL